MELGSKAWMPLLLRVKPHCDEHADAAEQRELLRHQLVDVEAPAEEPLGESTRHVSTHALREHASREHARVT